MTPSSHLPDPPTLACLMQLALSTAMPLAFIAVLLLAGMHALRNAHRVSTEHVLYSVAARAVFLLWHDMV